MILLIENDVFKKIEFKNSDFERLNSRNLFELGKSINLTENKKACSFQIRLVSPNL